MSSPQILDQLQFAALAFVVKVAKVAKGTDFGVAAAVEKFINHHVAFHGTSGDNAQNILLSGFKESTKGMLGSGVYATHDFDKASAFKNIRGGGNGALLKVEFNSSNIQISDAADTDGLWRNGYDAIYSTHAKRSEMCIKHQYITNTSPATGSMSEKARAKIDELFIKNPSLAKCTVWLWISAEVYAKARIGAKVGATCAGYLLNAMAGVSNKMGPEKLEQLINEGVSVGSGVGFAAGMTAATVASYATVTVPAAGVWGMLGYTTTAVAFGAGSLAAIGGAVALPVGLVAGAVYVASKFGNLRERE